MTTDTLERLKKSYTAGTIIGRDQTALIEELIRRSDAVRNAEETLKGSLNEIFENFIESIDTD